MILIGKSVHQDLKPRRQIAGVGAKHGLQPFPISSQIARQCRLSICNWFEKFIVFPPQSLIAGENKRQLLRDGIRFPCIFASAVTRD